MYPELLFPFVLASALSDVRTRRIPNLLILCGLCGAALARGHSFFLLLLSPGAGPGTGIFAPVVFSVTRASTVSALASLLGGCAGFLLPWLLFGPLAALKMLGGGDVKLLSVIGLWTGAAGILPVMRDSLITAAAWSLIIVLRRKNLWERLLYLYRYTGRALLSGRLSPYRTGPETASGEFCFAVPVLLAFTLWLCRHPALTL